jgi:tape measure domain-containing protein
MSEGNVQLKLKASLDLDFLRAQVASLGRSLKTTGFSVVATLDTDQIKKDVAKLTKEVKIKVNDSALDGLSDRIDKAQLRLKELQSESSNVVIGVTGRAAVTQKDARKIRADVYRGIMQNGGKILLPVGLRPISQTAVDAFKTDLRQKLGSITVNVQAQLESAAVRKGAKTPAEIDAEVRRGLQAISEMGASRMAGGGAGGVTETARKESLRKSIEDLTVAQLRQVAKQLEVGGASKLRRADLINKIVADASVEMVKKYLDPQAMMRGGDRGQLQKVLDTFARGVFNMLGMDPASVRAKRLPAAIDWPAQVPERRIPIGPSSTGRALPGAAAATMLPGTRLGDQKQLVGDILSPSLKEILRGAANAFADSVRREMNAAVRSVSVRDFGNAIRQIPMLSAAAPQGALPAGRSGGALAVQSELTDFYRVVEVQVRNTFDFIADHHQRSLNNFRRAYQEAIDSYHRRALLGAASQGTRQARVVDLGSGQPMLAGAAGGSPPMLPPAGGSGFRGGGGFVPPGGFPSDGPQGLSRPIRAPQTELPRGYLAAGKMAAGLRDADQYLRQAQVPLAGAIEGLGSEFANATKQVLLYGTAYKALAFFMDLPNQALAAATALQTFRNQLNAVTGSSENASRSFGFIDSLADRFAVPLESVRQGFVRMYASMEPAGFGATEIEGLFTGVSKAAATFGMSKDQVDRVTYALSQMASKGQIMAEELRGQLGDVLPGSFALFAEAAQMSIPEFTKAMEQGRFSGEAMRVVLNNVAILLNTKFASGAEGAAKTLQGALNTMGTGMQRLYESFEPLVNEVAQRVFPLIAEAMADATSGIKAFVASITGANAASGALSRTASVVAQVLQSFAEIGRAIGVVLASILPTLAGVGRALLFITEQVARFINTDFGGWLAGVAVQALLLNTVLVKFVQILGLNLLPLLVAAINKMRVFAASVTAMAVAKGTATAATFAFTTALKALLIPLLKFAAPVAIVAGIMAIADAFGSASKRARELRAAAIDATQAIRGMSTTEAIQAGRTASSDIRAIQAISSREDEPSREGFVAVSPEEKAALARAGISTTKQATGRRGASGIVDMVERNRLTAATLSAEGRKAEADFRVKQNRFEEQRPKPELQPIPPGEGAGDGGASSAGKAFGEYESSRLEFLQQRLTIEKQILEARLQQNLISETAFKLAIAELEFETEQATIAEELRLRVLAANKENLSAADKIRKVKDLEEIAERKLLIATEKRAIVLGGIKKELAGPILDANEQNNEQISEQNMLLGRLANGYQGLSIEQKAILEVGKLTNKLSGDQLGQLREEIALLEKSTMERIKNDQAINYARRIGALQNEIQLLLTANDVERERLRIRQEFSDLTPEQPLQIINLEEIKKKIQDVRAMIDDLVSSTVSDYKGFFKSVLFGEDPVEALKEFQKRLADKTLTLFLDFAMAPVEQFFKENLFNLFKPEESKEVAAATSNTSALDKNTAAIEANTVAQVGQAPTSAMANVPSVGNASTSSLFSMGGLGSQAVNAPMAIDIAAFGGASSAIDSLNESVYSVGDAIPSFKDSLGNITDTVHKASEETNAQGATFSENLGKAVGAIGIAATSVMGIAAGIGQIKEGGASNVLGGIGSVLMGIGGAMGGFGNLFPGKAAANGAVWQGGFTAFANGGVVNGPTLGLVGEGKYNEAIVPLPDGRSIPVKMAGGSSARSIMEDNGRSGSSSPSTLSLSFETTKINGVEYVSRDQLELAMAATRKEATREGATRGMNMTIDKIKNSPSTRNSLGMGRR